MKTEDPKDCECYNWAFSDHWFTIWPDPKDEINKKLETGHHPTCEHYIAPHPMQCEQVAGNIEFVKRAMGPHRQVSNPSSALMADCIWRLSLAMLAMSKYLMMKYKDDRYDNLKKKTKNE